MDILYTVNILIQDYMEAMQTLFLHVDTVYTIVFCDSKKQILMSKFVNPRLVFQSSDQINQTPQYRYAGRASISPPYCDTKIQRCRKLARWYRTRDFSSTEAGSGLKAPSWEHAALGHKQVVSLFRLSPQRALISGDRFLPLTAFSPASTLDDMNSCYCELFFSFSGSSAKRSRYSGEEPVRREAIASTLPCNTSSTIP